MGNTSTALANAPQGDPSHNLGNHSTQQAGAEKYPPKSFMERSFDDPVAVFTLWLAIATTGLWIFTYRLWKATAILAADAKASGIDQANKMERSIEQAARAAQAMEALALSNAASATHLIESINLSRQNMRASLMVEVGSAVYQAGNLRFEAKPKIINRGATPAKNVRWKIAAEILPVPMPAGFRFPLPREYSGGSVIGPQADGYMSAIVGQPVPDEAVAAIREGRQHALYVWGFVAYNDIFGKRHRTTFAQLLHWLPSGRKPLFGKQPFIVNGHYLAKHNRAD